jgi:hypothetical protein
MDVEIHEPSPQYKKGMVLRHRARKENSIWNSSTILRTAHVLDQISRLVVTEDRDLGQNGALNFMPFTLFLESMSHLTLMRLGIFCFLTLSEFWPQIHQN